MPISFDGNWSHKPRGIRKGGRRIGATYQSYASAKVYNVEYKGVLHKNHKVTLHSWSECRSERVREKDSMYID